jgi:hypothetical protein
MTAPRRPLKLPWIHLHLGMGGLAMRLLKLVTVAVVVLAVLAPQTSSAAGRGAPARFPNGAFIGTFPAGLFCPFPVYTQPVPIDRTQTVTLFFDKSGNVVKVTFTGVQYTLLENADTGKTIVVNSSGMGTLIPQPDGSALGTGGGPGLFGLSSIEGGATVHGPGIFLDDGENSFTVTAPVNQQTFIENLVVVGKVTSLCPVLAT